ncbi:MAG: hypothetical protein WBP09_01795, partial [Propionicimonas sp.]
RKETTMTNQAHLPVQEPLPDLPLIREELLAEIEQRRREGARPSELADLSWHYQQVTGREL